MAALYFDRDKCTLCGQCIKDCPFNALSVENGHIEAGASCKMCKLCIKKCPQGAVSILEDEKKSVDKSMYKGIMVYVEISGQRIHPVVLELLGKARELASKMEHPVMAVCPGGKAVASKAKALLDYGVDEVFVYSDEALEHFRVDAYANVVAHCIEQNRPSVVLVGATSIGRSLAPRLATRFRTGLTADCTALEMKENTDLVQIRPAFGGNIMAQIITPATRPQFATVRYKVMDAAKKVENPTGRLTLCPVPGDLVKSKIEVLRTKLLEKHKGIEDEDVLVVAGKGIKAQKDLEMLETLARALGGQLASTRPLVECGWMHYTKQIGLSGRTVKPKLIITCGVSGAIQFTAGMNGADCIVAINTDENAPIFKIANYCIVDDLYNIVPGLLKKLTAKEREV